MVTYTDMGFGIALAALLVCLCNLIYTLMDGHIRKPQNKVYIAILILLSVNACCELVNTQIAVFGLDTEDALRISKAAKYIYFLSHTLIAPMFFYYISYVVGRSVGIGFMRRIGSSELRYLLGFMPLCVAAATELVIALNPLTNWCWYFDADGGFHRAWGEYIFVYAIAALWIAGAFMLVMRAWNILSKTRKHSISICFLLAGAGIIVQLFSATYRIEVLMEALGFSGVLLFIENEDDRRNVELDAYNSAAFSLDLSAVIKNRIAVKVLIIRCIRFDNTANTIVSGRINRDTISQAVSEYLGTVVKRYYIYSIGHGRFALTLYNYKYEDAHKLAQVIEHRFESPWNINGVNLILSAKLLLVDVPNRAKHVEDIIYIAECPIPPHMQDCIIEGKALEWMIRRSSVEDAIRHGLETGSFEVYYQPTYNIDRTLHGAEALLRMKDERMGSIFPDEFIPIAEQLGMIDLLDEYVLKEVCKFFHSGVPQKNGLECINVNLSVLECMKEGFVEHISSIVEGAGISKNHINFEITESVAAKDYKHLASVIDQLQNEGFLFSIDDYGTGYSNMTSVFSLGADIIKIDKSILWNAETSELGMTLLKTSIDMVHQMQMKALMEGVETESQLKILENLGCDFLQGFYFSRPLPKPEFISLIEQARMQPD